MSLPSVFTGVATAFALALWLLFRLFPRISPDIRAWSWRLVILKFAISALAIGQVTLHLSSNSEFQAAAPRATVGQLRPRSTTHTILPGIERSKTPALAASAVDVRPLKHSETNFSMIAIAAWASGVVLFWIQAIFVAIRSRRALKGGLPVADPQIVESLEVLTGSSGLARPPRLVSLESAPSPMVCGIWRSTIVLPGRLASGRSEDLQLALGHEIAHVRRRDLMWAAIAWFVRSTLFFNPMVWIAEKELRSAQESATDQEAVWLTGASVTAYGKMLLRAISPERVAFQPAELGMFDSFHNAQRRLRDMRYFSDRPHSLRKLGVALVVAAGIGCLPTYLIVPSVASPQLHPKQDARSATDPDSSGIVTPHVGGHKSGPASLRKEAHLQALTSEAKGSPDLSRILVPQPQTVSHSKPGPDLQFVEEGSNPKPSAYPESREVQEASKKALDEFNARVSKLINGQNSRIAEYSKWADQREWEAEQRESEAQQRKREGVQRARAALLREQVIEECEKNNYKFVGPDQRETDAQVRRDDKRQAEADKYQLVLDQKQRETDRWQRSFDDKSIAAMRQETTEQIAIAKRRYQDRIAELRAGDESREQEANNALAYAEDQVKSGAAGGFHYVKAATGLSFAIPDGYKVVRLQENTKDSYTVVLRHK